jgi:hypothetical protein
MTHPHPELNCIDTAQFASITRTRVVNSGSGEVRSLRPLAVVRLRIVTCSVSR